MNGDVQSRHPVAQVKTFGGKLRSPPPDQPAVFDMNGGDHPEFIHTPQKPFDRHSI
jgi:hypothetical protein